MRCRRRFAWAAAVVAVSGILTIAAAVPLSKGSTYWNPSWTTATGAVQSTDITDLATTAEGGEGVAKDPTLPLLRAPVLTLAPDTPAGPS